ncbi:TetR/AcrR family transcriptional regulator [Caballeronia sp. BR00000012568055]|uniref:TetR/AcrR family transcriptional regulator n=1 Tax=Caballeronia sp. BR00000012568055 TaxID=2918761 RepID=UPI0023F6234A|nr:WHG domain-containing protein [Caballeronia sp. BR00000012568055]
MKEAIKKTRGKAVVEAERPYHHGALRDALLDAAETVLRRDGLRGLTLRAISREVGVSHTAPQRHFNDTAGVLSELAAIGHHRLAASMAAHAKGIENEIDRRKAIARGYIKFAVKQPDLFRLMSRNELLDQSNEALGQARRMSIRALAGTIARQEGGERAIESIDTARAVEMTAGWAYVHGLATLLIDGRLDSVARITDNIDDAAALVETAIERMRLVLADKITRKH